MDTQTQETGADRFTTIPAGPSSRSALPFHHYDDNESLSEALAGLDEAERHLRGSSVDRVVTGKRLVRIRNNMDFKTLGFETMDAFLEDARKKDCTYGAKQGRKYMAASTLHLELLAGTDISVDKLSHIASLLKEKPPVYDEKTLIRMAVEGEALPGLKPKKRTDINKHKPARLARDAINMMVKLISWLVVLFGKVDGRRLDTAWGADLDDKMHSLFFKYADWRGLKAADLWADRRDTERSPPPGLDPDEEDKDENGISTGPGPSARPSQESKTAAPPAPEVPPDPPAPEPPPYEPPPRPYVDPQGEALLAVYAHPSLIHDMTRAEHLTYRIIAFAGSLTGLLTEFISRRWNEHEESYLDLHLLVYRQVRDTRELLDPFISVMEPAIANARSAELTDDEDEPIDLLKEWVLHDNTDPLYSADPTPPRSC